MFPHRNLWREARVFHGVVYFLLATPDSNLGSWSPLFSFLNWTLSLDTQLLHRCPLLPGNIKHKDTTTTPVPSLNTEFFTVG